MTRTLAEIQNDALRLTPEDRMHLIQALLASMMTDEDRAAEEILIEEAERRYQEWKDSGARGVSGEEVLTRLREKYGNESLRASR